MSPARAIFIDIDGVLNSRKTPNPRALPYVIDKKLLRLFRRLVRRSRAKVVLISDWRHDPAGLFSARYQGLRYNDIVPELRGKSRGNDIRMWLKKHPAIKRYVVIDDDDDDLDDFPLFQPSASTGLTQKMATAVLRYLQGKTNKDMRAGAVVRAAERVRKGLKRVI